MWIGRANNLPGHSCTGAADVSSTKQPLIWALGTGQNIASDDKKQSLNEHNTIGTTSINLVKATGGSGGNPLITDNSGNTNTNTNDKTNNTNTPSFAVPMSKADKLLLAHGMVFAAVSWSLATYIL